MGNCLWCRSITAFRQEVFGKLFPICISLCKKKVFGLNTALNSFNAMTQMDPHGSQKQLWSWLRCFLSKENREKLLSECFVQKIRTVMTKGRSCEITPFQYAATVNSGNRHKFTLSIQPWQFVSFQQKSQLFTIHILDIRSVNQWKLPEEAP